MMERSGRITLLDWPFRMKPAKHRDQSYIVQTFENLGVRIDRIPEKIEIGWEVGSYSEDVFVFDIPPEMADEIKRETVDIFKSEIPGSKFFMNSAWTYMSIVSPDDGLGKKAGELARKIEESRFTEPVSSYILKVRRDGALQDDIKSRVDSLHRFCETEEVSADEECDAELYNKRSAGVEKRVRDICGSSCIDLAATPVLLSGSRHESYEFDHMLSRVKLIASCYAKDYENLLDAVKH